MDTNKEHISPTEAVQNLCLQDDPELLDLMVADSKSQPPLYNPGPYWATKARNAVNEIKRCGLADFRGSTNLIGLSYADNLHIDIRDMLNHGLMKRLVRWLTRAFPLNRIYDAQVQWTKSYADMTISYAQEILNLKADTRILLKKYRLPYSLLGNCRAKVNIDGEYYSIHYLNLLEQHDRVAAQIDFHNASSFFEIGGGFGINSHLLLENYHNIRKVLYLDIPPNLYVGTQYLKSFYGAAVADYRALQRMDSIRFSADDKLEIFCIAPWQIEKFASEVDILMNAHSFVEMPKDVVRNYTDKFSGLPGAAGAAIALTSYDCFDLSTTFHPSELPQFFKGRKFTHFAEKTLLDSAAKNLYYLSPGKLSLP